MPQIRILSTRFMCFQNPLVLYYHHWQPALERDPKHRSKEPDSCLWIYVSRNFFLSISNIQKKEIARENRNKKVKLESFLRLPVQKGPFSLGSATKRNSIRISLIKSDCLPSWPILSPRNICRKQLPLRYSEKETLWHLETVV